MNEEDILSQNAPAKDQNVEKADAKERYEYKYSPSEWRNMFKSSIRPLVSMVILVAVLCVIPLVFMLTSDTSDIAIGLWIGWWVALIFIYIMSLVLQKKNWRAAEKRSVDCVRQYEVYENYFTFKLFKNGELIQSAKVYFEEIEKVTVNGNFLQIQHRGIAYIFDKTTLIENSLLLSYAEKNGAKLESKGKSSALNVAASWLFLLAILSFFVAMVCEELLYLKNSLVSENMWVFFAFTPIPIASIAFGIYLKKKGEKYKKNVVVGIVMTILMCFFGAICYLL